MPRIDQVQSFKTRFIHKRNGLRTRNQEYEQVIEYLKRLGSVDSKAALGPDQPIGFGLKDGTDEDHFFAGFTSLNWLHWSNAYKDTFTIYHLDSTHKVNKNRFTLVVYSRSDVS